jgi:hypothetical protein
MHNMTNVVPWFALAVSAASAFFAGAAWVTNREKVRLDLYNRRFDVYSRTLDFLHALGVWKPTESEKTSTSLEEHPELWKAQSAFIKASREAQFLFADDSGVHKRLEQMHVDTMGIIGYKRDLAPKLNHPPDMIREHKNFEDRQTRIRESISLLEQEMSEYLDFHALSALGSGIKRVRRKLTRRRSAGK